MTRSVLGIAAAVLATAYFAGAQAQGTVADPTGDSVYGADITSVSTAFDGTNLRVTFDLAAALKPDAGAVPGS